MVRAVDFQARAMPVVVARSAGVGLRGILSYAREAVGTAARRCGDMVAAAASGVWSVERREM